MLTPLHRALEASLRAERRVDPFFRPLFDAVFREPLTAAIQWWKQQGLPDTGLAIAQERLPPEEAGQIDAIIAQMQAHLAQDFPPGRVERAGQTKTHGMLQATLTIREDLPEHLCRGIFIPGRIYPCWLRFSNGGPHDTPDIDDPGFTSMALKLLGVQGPRLMADEAQTQDFTAVCTPTFTTPDVRANVRLQHWSTQELGLWYFLDPRDSHVLDAILQALWTRTQANPLGIPYFSTVPCLMGAGQAMQFRFRPLTPVPGRIPRLPLRPPDNYLRDAMQATLTTAPASFEMALQLQTDAKRMPLDRADIRWSERLSPPVPVAHLEIAAQHFDTPERFALARSFRFSPWNGVVDHRPLGSQNRARGRIYRAMAEYRQAMNGVAHVEPSAADFA